jgi:ammonium transporter, Amt family
LNPDLDLEDESPLWNSIGVFVLWLGWFFFNGGSAYSLYNPDAYPAKIITNTILASSAAGGAVYFVKKPISLWYSKCFRKEGQYYKAFRSSQRFDGGSVGNGILAGLVAITSGCDAVEPWAAVCIGIIAGIVFSFSSKLILALNIDDPLDATSVHYSNGVWGIMSLAVFDAKKGFVSGNPEMGTYLGVQAYGVICSTLWAIAMAGIYFSICNYFNILRYHPVFEFVGAHRLQMGDISQKFLDDIRALNKKASEKVDYESMAYNKNKDVDVV